MATITPEEIHQAYEQAKLWYNHTITQRQAEDNLPTIKRSTAKDLIRNYGQLRKGVAYHRGMSQYALRYYLDEIYREFGKDALANALSSTKAHLEYNQQAGSGKWKIYEDFYKLLNTASPISTLPDDLREIEASSRDATTKEQLIDARLGQGDFRKAVIARETKCRVTGLANTELLIASHIKPWSACDDAERLSGDNGLLLSPHIDKLFDRGYLSFEDDGAMLISDTAKEALACWGITPKNVGAFHPKQKEFLAWHRKHLHKPHQNHLGACKKPHACIILNLVVMAAVSAHYVT
jgi:hypothetical protein